MSQVFVNNGVSTLAANVAAADTIIFIQAGHVARFPTIAAPDYCFVTLENAAGALEIVKVTAHGAASASLTAVRGQQGTTAIDWLAGDLVELRLTKDELNRFERAALRDGDTYSNAHNFTGATIQVKTPTTPTEAATKAYADSLIAAAAAAGAAGQLPNQTGKAGAYLKTDGASASWESIVFVGAGGAAITGNVTLTSASPGAMIVTPSGYGLGVTLPNATTCTKGVVSFSIYNAGQVDYAVINGAGTTLGWVAPGSSVLISLVDNTTVAGSWGNSNIKKVGLVAEFTNPTTSTANSEILSEVVIDADRTYYAFGYSSVYGVVHNKTTGQWGTPVLIATSVSAGQHRTALHSANLLVAAHLETTLNILAKTLTVTGTALVANTASTLVLGNVDAVGNCEVINGGVVVPYSTTTPNQNICAFSVSGTSCIWGAQQVINSVANGSIPPVIIPSGSIVRTFTNTGSSAIRAKPFTVAGNVLTAGTLANGAGGPSNNTYRVIPLPTGNVLVTFPYGGLAGSLFKLTGTVETVSNATITTTAPTDTSLYCDELVVSANKLLVTSTNSTSNITSFNIVTDTAGVMSVGTAKTYTTGSSSIGAILLQTSGNNATAILPFGTPGRISRVTFDCSGASLVEGAYSKIVVPSTVTSVVSDTTNVNSLTEANSVGGYRISGRGSRRAESGTSVYILTLNGATLVDTPEGAHYLPIEVPNHIPFAGVNSDEVYGFGGSITGASTGATILKYKVAP